MSAPAPDDSPLPEGGVADAGPACAADDAERVASRRRHRELGHPEPLARAKGRLFEMAIKGSALSEILTAACGFLDDQLLGSCSCVVVFDSAGRQVEIAAEAGLPRGLAAALAAGPADGNDLPWRPAATHVHAAGFAELTAERETQASAWRALALAAELSACSCTPLQAAEDVVVAGSLLVFWRGPHRPSPSDAALCAELSAVLALLIARTRADAALRASEERFRRIVDEVPGMICTTTASGEVDLVNRQVLTFFGRPLDELKNWTMIDAVHPEDLPRVVEEWKHSVATGTRFTSEQRQRRTDGVYRWHLTRAVPARDEEGRITGWNMLIADVDDRKRAEQALQRSEAYLTEAQRLSHTGSFGWKVRTGELVWSAETYRILGYDRSAPPDFDWVVTRIHPEDRELVRVTLERTVPARADLDLRHRLLMPDSTVRHLHVVARAAQPDGEDQEYIGVVMDITEQTRAQEAVQGAKARFEGILAIAHDAIISVDSEQRIILFNQGAEKVFGYAAGEVVGQPLDRLLPERFATAHRHHVTEFSASADVVRSLDQRRELFGRRKDGTEFPAEASISKLQLGSERVFTVILRDITERQRLENRLRRSERLLAEGQRLTKTGSWELDFRTGNTEWSVETCRIFGFPDPPPSPHYREFRARVRPEDREAVDRALRESFETGESRPLEYVFILPDGTRKDIETISVPVRDAAGTVVRLVGTVMDVTERKRAESQLRAAELVARGQLDALTQTLDALAREPDSDRLIEHVLRTIVAKLEAHSVSAWERDGNGDTLDLVAVIEEGRFKTRSDSGYRVERVPISSPRSAFWGEIFRTCQHAVFEDLDLDCARVRIGFTPESSWRPLQDHFSAEPAFALMKQHLQRLGVRSVLFVPMMVGGKVAGMIGVRFAGKRTFRDEQIELTCALAHQAMLAIQVTRLSAGSRRTAVVAERNRMARDIHDTIAQGLSGVIVQLEAAADATLKELGAEARQHLEHASRLARDSLNEARRSVRALRPQSLDEQSLGDALEHLLRNFTAGTPLRTRFNQQGNPSLLPPEWEENLLRIGQEVLSNALRHSRATEFALELAFEPQQIRLELADNGCGFDPHSRHDGFGLVGIGERVAMMGGRLQITSAPGRGTAVSILLPLLHSHQPSLP